MSPTDNLMKMHSDALKASNAAAAKTLEGFQKLAALNMQTAKTALEESSDQINALLAVRDPKALTELVTSFSKPSPEKLTAYAKAVYAITKEANGEFAAMVEKQIAHSNRQLTQTVEKLASQAPAGSEGAVEFIRQSLAAAQSAYEQVNTATKQFVQVAEANVEGAAKAAASAKKR